MNWSMRHWVFSAVRLIPLLGVLMLFGCDDIANFMPKGTETQSSEEEEEKRGPNGGILLSDGKFSVEITIFEAGRPPQYRVFPYSDSQPVDPAKVDLKIELGRLGGKVDHCWATTHMVVPVV